MSVLLEFWCYACDHDFTAYNDTEEAVCPFCGSTEVEMEDDQDE